MLAERVYVISLPQRQDRRDRLTAAWPYPHLLPEFRPAYWDPQNPSRGCLRSHLAALSGSTGPALILEDDAVFAPDFTLDLPAPDDWQVLWFGRQIQAGEHARPTPDGHWLARPWRISRTHAYVARDPRRLHAILAAAAIKSIDPLLSEVRVPQYLLRTATVGQAAGSSDITGAVRDADEFFN